MFYESEYTHIIAFAPSISCVDSSQLNWKINTRILEIDLRDDEPTSLKGEFKKRSKQASRINMICKIHICVTIVNDSRT